MSATLARARLCPLQRGFSFAVGRRGSGAKPWIQLRVRVGARAFSTPQEWTGLPAWRTNPVNDLRVWGKHGPQSLIHSTQQDVQDVMVASKKNPPSSGMDDDVFASHWEKLQRLENSVTRGGASSLAEWGALVLRTADPVEKAVFTHHAYLLWSDGEIPLGVAQPPESPARPEKPELVSYSLHFLFWHDCSIHLLNLVNVSSLCRIMVDMYVSWIVIKPSLQELSV